jgi:hypothetical protein
MISRGVILSFLLQPDDFSKMCIVLGSLADEMSDHALGFEDLEEE